MELIFVDGHGADGSFALIREIAASYKGEKRFVFTETPAGSGPGMARNVGIDAATSDYIAFVDSDDVVEPEFCQSLLDAALSCGADLACCNIYIDWPDLGKSTVKTNPAVTGGPFLDSERRNFLVNFVSYYSTFLYRKDFLTENGLRFPPTRNSEDTCYLSSCLLTASTIVKTDKPLYHYIKRPHSLSNTKDSGRYLQRLESLDLLLSYVKLHGLYAPYKQEIDFLYIKKAFLMACQTYVMNESVPDPSVLRRICALMDEKIPDNANNSYLAGNAKVRIAVWLIRRHPRLAGLVLKRINA
jgi:glycosyltransferase EpsH